jgi:flagellar biogenesis protein FliO
MKDQAIIDGIMFAVILILILISWSLKRFN